MKKNRKRIVTYILMGVMTIGCVQALEYSNTGIAADEQDGDVVENPFGELFTETETAGDIIIDGETESSDITQAGAAEESADTSATGAKETTEASVKKPGKTRIKKAVFTQSASGKINVKLKKIKNATGYQVKVSIKKNFKGKKTVTKKFTKEKITIKSSKLKNKSKLYVKARAYRVVGKTTYYGKWSAKKTVKKEKTCGTT